MAETPAGVLVAGYPDIGGATKDFGSLGGLVRDTQVSIDGVIVVAHAPDGSVAVRQTCGDLGREGLGWGGGAGLAARLFAPLLLASAAVGAVAGGVIGEFAGHGVERDIPGHSDS
jgi:uncharacterized membrane protein